jgi:hypothetical protein
LAGFFAFRIGGIGAYLGTGHSNKGGRYFFSFFPVRTGLFDIVGRSTWFGIRLIPVVPWLLPHSTAKTVFGWNCLVVASAQTSILFSRRICGYSLCLH